MTLDESLEIKKNPINREKYVRDKVRFKSKNKAVRIQKPWLSAQGANQVANRLEKEDFVQSLTNGIEQVLIDLNAKRLFKLNEHLDSEDESISLQAVKEAGNVVEKYQDRKVGKAKQSVELKSTKVEIKLDFSGQAAIKAPEVIEGETL